MFYEPERLFRPKLVRAFVERVSPNTTADFNAKIKILRNWRQTLETNKLNEAQLESAFATQILGKVLGYQGIAEGERVDYQFKPNTGLQTYPDITLGRQNPDQGWQATAIIELKAPKIEFNQLQANGKTPIEQAWGYANTLGNIQWVLVSNFRTIRLYSYRDGQKFAEDFDLIKASEPISLINDELYRLIALLSRDSLLEAGGTAKLLKDSLESQSEITKEFYYLYTDARQQFRYEILRVKPEIDTILALTKAQSLLNRIIFISFCEYSQPPLLTRNLLSNIWNHANPFDDTPLWNYFLKYFRAVEKGSIKPPVPAYNGGLFQPDEILDSLPIDFDRLREAVDQLTKYYFDENLSVTILGNIFENSIDEIEKEKTQEFTYVPPEPEPEIDAEGDFATPTFSTTDGMVANPEEAPVPVGRRKKEGIVYTPDTIARYIIESTLRPKFIQLWCDSLRLMAEPSPELEAIIIAARELEFNRFDSENFSTIKWQGNSTLLSFWKDYYNRVKALRIIDPSCGSGAFLVMAYLVLKSEFLNIDMRNSKPSDSDSVGELIKLCDNPLPRDKVIDSEILSMLYGSDLNPEAVEISKLSLWIKTAYRGKRLDSIEQNFRVGDSLLAGPAEFFPDIMAAGGFDIVVGNPPYVRQEFIPNDFKHKLQDHYRVYHGQADLYYYFYELGLRLLNPNGYLGFITSNTFLKSGSATVLRQMLRTETTLQMALNLGDNQYFNRVTTYPIILVTGKAAPADDHPLRYCSLGYDEHVVSLDDLAIFYRDHNYLYPQNGLTDSEWQLEETEFFQLRQKIILGRKKLAEVYGEPIFGIKTGLNEAFIINQSTRDKLVRADPETNQFVKPLLKGADVRRWYVDDKGQWLICIPSGWTKENLGEGKEAILWKEFTKRFPKIANHLNDYVNKSKLRSDMGDYWWELRPCNYYHLLEQPKIIWANICIYSRFTLDVYNYYINDTSFLLPSQSWDMLAYLNSNIVWYFLLGKCALLRGGYLRLRTIYTRTIPIPDMSPLQREQLAELGKLCQSLAEQKQKIGADFEPVVLKYLPADKQEKLTAKQKHWWSHNSFESFASDSKVKIPPKDLAEVKSFYQQKCTEWQDTHAALLKAESDINQLVYQIFDLTPSEIAIIEESTKGMEDALDD